MTRVPDVQQAFHGPALGGVRWRLGAPGLETDDRGIERTAGSPQTVTTLWTKYGRALEQAALRVDVPVELILAIMAASTRSVAVEELAGFEGDATTPHRVRVGVMRTTLADAREALRRRGVAPATVDRKWLLAPERSILAGAALIADQRRLTALDPPLVAAVYAGGRRELKDAADRWRRGVEVGRFVDDFVRYFNDLWAVLDEHRRRPRGPSLWSFFNAGRRLHGPLGPADPTPAGAFAASETGVGGFFPLGLRANLHTGIHLHGAKGGAPQPVRCLGPGWIVAARLGPEDPDAQRLAGNHRGFVLVRHEFVLDDPKKPCALYSLYMHLAPPAWPAGDAPLDLAEHRGVPWLDALARARLGSLVVVEPSVAAPGTVLWPATAPPTPLAGKVKVLADLPDEPADPKAKAPPATRDVDLGQPRHAERRALAVQRAQPEDLAQALAALRRGAVVTFAAPYLTVAAGDVLGHVRALPAGSGPLPTPWLHWELFAPPHGGVERLVQALVERLELDGSFQATLTSKDGDDLYTAQELGDLLGVSLPEGDKKRLPGGQLAGLDQAQAVLDLMHRGAPLSFGGERRDDDVKWEKAKEDLTYPVTFTVKNHLKLLDPSVDAVGFKVRFEPAGLPTGVARVSGTRKDAWELTVQVPGRATHILLDPLEDVVFDRAAVTSEPEVDAAARVATTFLSHRWRNLVLRRQTAWSPDVIGRALVARKFEGKGQDELTKVARALGWWDPGPAPDGSGDGEVAVLGKAGAERSLWPALLPKDGVVDHLHPVTAAWALETLARLGKLRLVERWAPASVGEVEPTHWGWVTLPPATSPDEVAVGEAVCALVVTPGLATGLVGGDEHQARLLGRGSASGAKERTVPLASAPYREGVAAPIFPMLHWGTWTLAVEGHEAATPAAGALPVKLTVHAPVLAFAEEPVRSRTRYAVTLHFRERCPQRLEGWAFLRVGVGPPKAPPPAQAQEVLPVAIAVDARPAAAKVRYATLDATRQFITQAAERLEVPFEGSSLRFGEYRAAASARGAIKLSLHLAHLVARVRRTYGAWMSLSQLAADGLSIRLRCYHAPRAKKPIDTRTPELHAKLLDAARAAFGAAQVQEAGELVTVSVPAPGPGAGAMTLELSPAEAFDAALKGQTLQEGERLHVTLGLVFPCGGRHVEVVEPGRSAEQLTLDAVKDACGAERLEVWAAAPSTELSQPRIRDVRARVTKTQKEGWIELEAALSGGTYEEWSRARPQFAWTGSSGEEHRVGAHVRGKHQLVGHVSLVDKDLPAGKITFRARTTAEETVFGGDVVAVPPVEVELDPRQPQPKGGA